MAVVHDGTLPVDGGPWKLVPNFPPGKVSLLASSSVEQVLLLVATVPDKKVGWVPCYLLDWQVGAPGRYFLAFLCPPSIRRHNEGQPGSYVAKV